LNHPWRRTAARGLGILITFALLLVWRISCGNTGAPATPGRAGVPAADVWIAPFSEVAACYRRKIGLPPYSISVTPRRPD
jgi:hypothetical protein